MHNNHKKQYHILKTYKKKWNSKIIAANTFRQIDTVFTVICIAVAIFFTAHCIHQYCKNEDSSIVTFSEFHSSQDTIYPGLTSCFRQYIKKGTFSEHFLGTFFWKEQILQQISGGENIVQEPKRRENVCWPIQQRT